MIERCDGCGREREAARREWVGSDHRRQLRALCACCAGVCCAGHCHAESFRLEAPQAPPAPVPAARFGLAEHEGVPTTDAAFWDDIEATRAPSVPSVPSEPDAAFWDAWADDIEADREATHHVPPNAEPEPEPEPLPARRSPQLRVLKCREIQQGRNVYSCLVCDGNILRGERHYSVTTSGPEGLVSSRYCAACLPAWCSEGAVMDLEPERPLCKPCGGRGGFAGGLECRTCHGSGVAATQAPTWGDERPWAEVVGATPWEAIS